MPRGKLTLPPESFHLLTSTSADKFYIGRQFKNPRKQSQTVEVVALVEATRDGETVYHVWVVPVD